MTLKELVQNHTWLSVSSVLRALYPNEGESILGYESVFNNLKVMNPEDVEMLIVLKSVTDDDDEGYVDVSGKHKYPKTEEEKFSQAIEFSPWSHWLGMDICAESLKEFSELEIIVHCLYEMTFMGFDEGKIQSTLLEIDKRIEDYQSLTDEEKKENTISLQALLEKWGDDDDDEEDDNEP